MKRILTTPIDPKEIADLRVGDVVYLSGIVATARDAAHKRILERGLPDGADLNGGAIFHAGPIMAKDDTGKWHTVAIGPTTSMRMEDYQKEVLEQTGVRLLIGKGGMGERTKAACKKYKAIHTVFPGGCAVLAASAVEEVLAAEWQDLGMPEAFWVLKVKELGPLIVSIDTKGNSLFESNRALFAKRKDEALQELLPRLDFGH